MDKYSAVIVIYRNGKVSREFIFDNLDSFDFSFEFPTENSILVNRLYAMLVGHVDTEVITDA